MDQFRGFGFENKHNKQSLKIDPGTHKKLGMLKDAIQYENLPCNMSIYHKKRIIWFSNTVHKAIDVITYIIIPHMLITINRLI
jgi:hypothetical protein